MIFYSNYFAHVINALTSAHTSWLDHKYTEKELQTIMYCFSQNITDPQKIRAALDATKDIKSRYFKLGARAAVRKKLLAYYSGIKELQGGGFSERRNLRKNDISESCSIACSCKHLAVYCP